MVPVVRFKVLPVHKGPLLPVLPNNGFTYTIVKPKVSELVWQASPLITLLNSVVPIMVNGFGE